jgi:cardiolipin synthase
MKLCGLPTISDYPVSRLANGIRFPIGGLQFSVHAHLFRAAIVFGEAASRLHAISSLNWRPYKLLASAAFVTLSACASLPDVNDLNTSLSPDASPTVTNARGTLGEKKTKSLLAKRWPKSTIDIAALAALEEAATGVPLISGNKVTLLFDGPQTTAAMIAAITSAKDNINLETYVFDQDALGLRFADLLIAKQQEGVQVSIIYDAFGVIGTPEVFFDRMRNAGINLIAFNPVNPLSSAGRWRLNNRDHRKILVVDGMTAFTGGVNISNTYANGSMFRSRQKVESKIGWRDTHIKIEGPAVAALQWAFLKTWASQQAGDLPMRKYFPQLKDVGDQIVRVLASEPGGDYEIYKAYVLSIQEARRSIHITSAYFVPDKQVVEALCQAVKRGVDVKIVLPGVSDSGLVLHASRSFYSQLLDSGVKIYELRAAVLHAKTAVIDGVWSTVGSTNIDIRSFLHNNEINVIVLGDAFGLDMENAFGEDLRDSIQITAGKWAQRPVADRMKEWLARTMAYWL